MNGVPRILRVSHSLHRTEQLIEAELDWVNHLAESGVHVCRPLPSAAGVILETIEAAEGRFILTAFEQAPGKHLHGGDAEWGPALFEEWGRITGLMHLYAQDYVVPEGRHSRTRKGPSTISEDRLSVMSPYRVSAYRSYRAAADRVRLLPRSKASYGLCHRDLHHGNFQVNNGSITAFDFDDCGYDYFLHDVAIAVYYTAVFSRWKQPVTSFEQCSALASRTLEHFLNGYERVYHIDDERLKELPLFIEKRRSDMCVILYNRWSKNDGNPDQRNWLQINLEQIRNEVPCLTLL